jgi:NCAIR mutase (PurE)-related protein
VTPAVLKKLLEKVASGDLSAEQAFEKLRGFPSDDLGFARIDTHREIRTGIPEVVYGAGKTTEQVIAIAQRIVEREDPLIATRITPEVATKVNALLPNVQYHPEARMLTATGHDPPMTRGHIAVVAAGTSDLPVAEEAAVTAESLETHVERITDVGVAALHRILDSRSALDRADAIIVVAGMEGALPSVVGGLTDRPVIAVPTSVGYGAAFGGLAALLGMLTSCAPGVSVVNIDNGFGAAVQAVLIARRTASTAP